MIGHASNKTIRDDYSCFQLRQSPVRLDRTDEESACEGHVHRPDKIMNLEEEFQEKGNKAKIKEHDRSTVLNSDNMSQCGPGVSDEGISITSSLRKMSLSSYLYAELTRGYLLEHEEAKYSEKRERVYTFMKIPRELEKFMTYGFFQCVDAFLYMFTFLPLRVIVALIKLCVKVCTCWSTPGRVLEPAQICDLLKGFILISCCICMNYVDVSMMYHIIRGQAIIKLYIFFNMLEVFDRLFSSFGQDILDSLFWTATEPRGKKREHFGVLPHMLMAVVYVFLHCVLVLFQATTLNVAFNSHNKALLTIMMSNNFVELKGSVFKKFEKNNLFQMSCSDVRERFHFVVLLAIVAIRNLTEFSWNMDHLWVLVPDIALVLFSEVFVDWVKHAFITKFNDISYEVYREYTVSLAYDMANSRQKNAFSDQMELVSRRMGFIPLPLAVLMIRVVIQSLRINGLSGYGLAALFFLCLLSFKVLNSILLMGTACNYIDESKQKSGQNAKTATKPSSKPNEKAFEFKPPGATTPHPTVILRQPQSRDDLIRAPPSAAKEASLAMQRSQSVSDMNPTPSVEDIDPCPLPPQSPSLTPKPLFSNSTVSLASVGLNEEYIKDCREADRADNSASLPVGTLSELESLRQRTGEGVAKEKKPEAPLSEVDRFSMVSNRIV